MSGSTPAADQAPDPEIARGLAEPDPAKRATYFRKLGEKNADRRPGVGLRDGLPDIIWCRVPAGPFQMGGDPKAWEAWPGATIELPYDYWLAAYPVTYAQYAPFVEGDGYTNRAYWTDAGWAGKGDRTRPAYWQDAKWHISNHPVVGVSWYEAYAYTQWLEQVRQADRLMLPPGVPSRHRLRLPTEAEWEKAARYPDGRYYPWGKDYQSGRANIDERRDQTGPHHLARTTAVGSYPAGTHPELGIADLSGNVWEWCQSAWADKYQHPEDNRAEGQAPRVLRGGSWRSDSPSARSASRGRLAPGGGWLGLGFRLVVSAPLGSADR